MMENRNLFLFAQSCLAMLAFVLVDKALMHGPLLAVVVALCISFVPMHMIAYKFERRALWPPSSQYASFFWGDLIFLPACAASIAAAVARTPGYESQSFGWHAMYALIGIAAGLTFHVLDKANYSFSELNSPTKLWHDFFVYPVFTYYLLSNVRALFSPFDGLSVLAFACVGGWALLAMVDKNREITEAHISYDWNLNGQSTNRAGS